MKAPTLSQCSTGELPSHVDELLDRRHEKALRPVKSEAPTPLKFAQSVRFILTGRKPSDR